MKNKKNNEEEFEDDLPLEKQGARHLIECNCVLPQYKNSQPPIWHQFAAFSIIDENDKVQEKFVQCNNCGIIHKITEIGASEILTKESFRAIRKIPEIKLGIHPDISGLMDQYDLDVSTWEEVEFILNNKKWGSSIILSKEIEGDTLVGKALVFQGEPVLARIESFSRQEVIR